MKDFPPQLPHGEIQEILSDIFFVTGQVQPNFGGKILKFSRNMAVIRSGKSLTLVNTLRLDKSGLERLDSLGTVENIVKLGSFHGRDDAFYIDRYGAPFWAPQGMTHERRVQTDKELAPDAAGPFPDATVFSFETADVPESILHLTRHDGILITCDSLQNWTGPDEYFDEATATIMKAQGFSHPANIGPGWFNSAKPEHRDFLRLKELNFTHLLSAHGEPLFNDAYQAVSSTIGKNFAD